MLYRFLIGVCFCVSICFFYMGLTSDSQDYLKKHEQFYIAIDNLDPPLNKSNFSDEAYLNYQSDLDSLNSNAQLNNLRWLYGQRISNYEKNLSSLNSTLQSIIILGVLGLLTLFYRPEGIPVPFISLQIPQNMIYIFVIVGGVYLWSHLGLLMNAAIDSRLTLHVMTEYLENFSDYHTNYLYSNTHVLVDSGFLDNWCSFFYDIFHRNPVKSDTATYWLGIVGLYGVYGILFGVFYAVVFAVAIDFLKRKKTGKGLKYVLLVFTVLLLILDNVAWAYKFSHTMTFGGWYWCVAGLGLIIWKWKGQVLADQLSNSGQRDLEGK